LTNYFEGLAGDSSAEDFGARVCIAGDLNSDGYDDVIVSAPASTVGGTDAGRVYVFFCGPGAGYMADVTVTGVWGEELGRAIASAGDVNDDGYDDIVLGSLRAARVYFGGAAMDATPDLALSGPWGQAYGPSVAAAGDMNGDGYDDLIVGEPDGMVGGVSVGGAYVTCIFPYQLLSPNGGDQWIAGEPATVRWRGHDIADVDVSLDAGSTWARLATSVGGEEENECTVIAPAGETDRAQVRVVFRGQSADRATSDASEGVFRIVPRVTPPPVAAREQFAPAGAAAGDVFGRAVASAGDMNGDGYADFAVGAPGYAAGVALAVGRVYVYFGGPAADLVPDLVLTGVAAGDQLGGSVSGAGDVNGDGYADLLVGAPGNDDGGSNAGAAYLFYGGPAPDAIADLVFTGAAAGDALGSSVSAAGDVNGDGYADLVIGAGSNDAGGTTAGRVYVYLGGPGADTIADWVFTGEVAGEQLGAAVAGAGDVNGDGFADIIAGAPSNDLDGTNAGRAYVYYGGLVADSRPDLVLHGAAAGDLFGFSVAGAGDVNGDGFGDLVVGAGNNDAGGADGGAAYVFYGGVGADNRADLVFTGSASSVLGVCVGAAGDVNGDGFGDVVAGANGHDGAGVNAGRMCVYFGGAGADNEPDLVFNGAAAGDGFGSSVAAAGDVNGDGFPDLIAGAMGNDAGGANAGRAYLYNVNRYFVLGPNGGQTWNVGATQEISWLGAEPADVWLSVDGGGSYQLIDHAVGGSAHNRLAWQVPHLPTKFAKVKVAPANAEISGHDAGDALFTIQASVELLKFAVADGPDGGTELSWSTEPPVGTDGIAGYRLYRGTVGSRSPGERIGPDLITETRYTDFAGGGGVSYRIAAINGLGEELELGQVSNGPVRSLSAWPMPYRGGDLHVSFALYAQVGASSGDADVRVYDLSGRQLKILAQGVMSGRQQTVTWDGRDEHGVPLAAGVYFIRARSGSQVSNLKLAVLR
jgi:hypothetical protein